MANAQRNPYDDDDECFDVDNTKRPQLAPNATPDQKADHAFLAEKQRQAQVLYLSLLCQSTGVVTEVQRPTSGDAISDEYFALFTNTSMAPVRVQVFSDLVTPGCGAVLSFDNSKGDQGKFDTVSFVANGHTESISVLVLPGLSIWARDFSNAIPMGSADMLRIRIFDPMKLISSANLFSAGR